MSLIDKHPRQVFLFMAFLFVLGCYMVALIYRLPTDTLQGLLWGIGGGLIAELTGTRQQQHIDVERIENQNVASNDPH